MAMETKTIQETLNKAPCHTRIYSFTVHESSNIILSELCLCFVISNHRHFNLLLGFSMLPPIVNEDRHGTFVLQQGGSQNQVGTRNICDLTLRDI